MGMHTGPALDPSSAMTIVAWLEAEQAERIPAAADPIRFGPVQPLLGGETAVDLGGGDTLTFTSATSGGGLYLSDLTITAGPGGLHVAHPLFVSHPTGALPLPDTVDRFGDVDAKLGPNKMLALGGGDALFLDFLPTDPLTIHFHTLEAP
jgi:hypothetical protein